MLLRTNAHLHKLSSRMFAGFWYSSNVVLSCFKWFCLTLCLLVTAWLLMWTREGYSTPDDYVLEAVVDYQVVQVVAR